MHSVRHTPPAAHGNLAPTAPPAHREPQPPGCPLRLTPPCTAPGLGTPSPPLPAPQRRSLPRGAPASLPPLRTQPSVRSLPSALRVAQLLALQASPGTGENPESSSSPALPGRRNFLPSFSGLPKEEPGTESRPTPLSSHRPAHLGEIRAQKLSRHGTFMKRT